MLIAMERRRSEGGVEEQKEETPELESPTSFRHNRNYVESMENEAEEQEHGFQAQVENLAKVIFGSCGMAMEAASIFVGGAGAQGCRWVNPAATRPAAARGGGAMGIQEPSKPPLSIADELRRLAAQEGRVFPFSAFGGAGNADIPHFLGEDAVQSFEDDNISALSQHTLEELAQGQQGLVHTLCRKRTESPRRTPPSPTRTRSLSTNSSERIRRDSRRREAEI